MIEFAQFLAEVSELESDGIRSASAPTRVPYSWQEQFARACLSGDPPQMVGVPTGAGKTTAVDALVWALAAQLVGGSQRTLGLRIVWAIDRRILVDEVHEHALRLSRRLDLALDDADDTLHEAAAALAALSGGRPLVATRWRGGLGERAELQSPLQPEVITSTVAQIGSRLLFRGYGVGRRSLNLAAGLAARDTTICLDEAHLADPFRQTAERIAAMQREKGERLGVPELRLVELTATPRQDGGDAIVLSEDDKRQLGPRWDGTKTATLVTPESENDGGRVEALVAECLDLLKGGVATLACVANTVFRARRVWSALKAKLGDDADLVLLIGPQRQADRDRLLNAPRKSVLFGGATPDKPLVVVATQTFEVGLDVDVKALVTESASSSALVQRLGRLNRAGGSAGTAVIVRDADSWLYGEDEELAWTWLESRQGPGGKIDVSVATLHNDPKRPTPEPPADAPLLTRNVVECLVQTAPMPHRWGNPDVESFLKGAASDPTADVELCWRSDLRLDTTDARDIEYSRMLIELVPPGRRELLKLNVSSARSLLLARLNGASASSARAALSDADIEGAVASKAALEPAAEADSLVRFLVKRHGEVHAGAFRAGGDRILAIDEIAPGDVLILPSSFGGCDEFGLNPRAEIAMDVAADVDPEATVLPTAIRLTSGAIRAATEPREEGTNPRVPRLGIDSTCGRAWKALEGTSNPARQQVILGDLATRLAELMPEHRALGELAQRLNGDDGNLVLSLRALGPLEPDGTPRPQPLADDDRGDGAEEAHYPTAERADEGQEDSGEALESSWVLLLSEPQDVEDLDRSALANPSPPTLTEHNLAVRRQLDEYLGHLDLLPQVRESLLMAAATHDLGKAEPRFQDFLYGGRAPLGAISIAKSVFGTRDPAASRLARKVSGLPAGFRHEVESVSIVATAMRANDTASPDLDLDLTLACGGGHHGLGLPVPGVARSNGRAARPFTVGIDEAVGVASGDSLSGWDHGEWLERFWRVIDRYGAWGFSYLLSLVIASDRAVSSRGE